MKTSGGYDQFYNGPIAVDAASQLIVATSVSNCATGHDALLPLVDSVQATLGGDPAVVLADAGYKSEATFHTLETREIAAYTSLGRERKASPSPHPAQVAARLTSADGEARYRRRKAIVEPVFGWIKAALGFRRFSLRREANTHGEWNVVCLAVNLKRFHRITMT